VTNRLYLFLALSVAQMSVQQSLSELIGAIAKEAKGKVSVACSLPGTSMNCDLNPPAHSPMQSVFKAPLALTALHVVERGELGLDQLIRFRASDRILPRTYSPLQEKYPAAEVDIPLRELLRLAVSLSDNAAADVVLRIIGGPAVVNAYIKTIGISGFQLSDGEAAMHRDAMLQYRNWIEPAAAVQFLRLLIDNPPVTHEHATLLLDWMQATPRGNQPIRGLLPEGTAVMHKAGSSGADNGLARATNDIGLIALLDGRRLAIAIFVTDSTAEETTRDSVFARIAKAAYDAAVARQRAAH
jgi:beta-lactamase class A